MAQGIRCAAVDCAPVVMFVNRISPESVLGDDRYNGSAFRAVQTFCSNSLWFGFAVALSLCAGSWSGDTMVISWLNTDGKNVIDVMFEGDEHFKVIDNMFEGELMNMFSP